MQEMTFFNKQKTRFQAMINLQQHVQNFKTK